MCICAYVGGPLPYLASRRIQARERFRTVSKAAGTATKYGTRCGRMLAGMAPVTPPVTTATTQLTLITAALAFIGGRSVSIRIHGRPSTGSDLTLMGFQKTETVRMRVVRQDQTLQKQGCLL